MNVDQYQILLTDLAHVAGLPDIRALTQFGELTIAGLDAVLEHDISLEADLLQVSLCLGTLPRERNDLQRAVLEANYHGATHGNCVFSVMPESNDVIVTVSRKLSEVGTAQALWEDMSQVAANGAQAWTDLVASHPRLGSESHGDTHFVAQ